MKNILCLPLLIISLVPSAQTFKRYDIIIDEIMADPSPQVELPNTEYIELRNISSYPIDLKGFIIADLNSSATIKESFVLNPDSMIVLCSNSGALALAGHGRVIGITSFPSLDNEGDLIMILSPNGRVIHSVKYSGTWYKNDLKRNGGWSIEMIDTGKPWTGELNWKASTDGSGGTPGEENSVAAIFDDHSAPQLLKAFATDSAHIELAFDESLDSTSATSIEKYVLDDVGIQIISAEETAPLFDKINLTISAPLQKGKIYSLNVNNISDCNGNVMRIEGYSRVGISEVADSVDIVINEILFHPNPGGNDYLELYNRGEKILNLQELFISNRASNGTINPPIKISEEPVLFFPGDFLLLTENIERTAKDYVIKNPKSCLEMKSLPSFPNDEGHALILNFQGKLIDELQYSEKWHFPLIVEKAGISLERINFEKPTQEKSNWHSAGRDAGFGTPSYENSQAYRPTTDSEEISISSDVFSPDNDGFNDFVTINYQFSEPVSVCNISIYDFEGRCIKHLVRSALCGTRGYFVWDGLNDKNQKSRVGIYILFAEFFDLQGKVQKFRKPIVVASKF